MFIDLDNFKVINDSLGHNAGDLLLTGVAERLKGYVRKVDTVSRLAGDEFTIILNEVEDAQDVNRVASKIIDGFKEPFIIEGQERFASVSIGISTYPVDGKYPSALLKNADAAMYQAKEVGRNNFQRYNKTMTANVERRFELETLLHNAMENGEFELYYQPQISLVNGDVSGLEALLRWNRPDVGMISPAEFIPIVEDTGMIDSIGEWFLNEIGLQMKKWKDKGLPAVRIGANISARQLGDEDFANKVMRVVKAHDIDPTKLELELTESAIMAHRQLATNTLNQLVQNGISLALDDFGTGFSSLSQLKQMPFQIVKIDSSFVSDIAVNPGDAELINAIIVMSHTLHRTVVAEGVETREQLDILMEMGCDIIQGYFFSRPVPAIEVEPLLGKTDWLINVQASQKKRKISC